MRNRLTEGVFIPENPDEAITQLETALRKVVDAEPLERKIRKHAKEFQPAYKGYDAMLDAALANGIIDDVERNILKDANDIRTKVIQVDSFTADLKRKN
jgi:acyl-CoA dehydrogenase